MAGHVFIVRSDLRKLACDAWLIPTIGRARPGSEWFLAGYAGPRQCEPFADGGPRVQPLLDHAPEPPTAVARADRQPRSAGVLVSVGNTDSASGVTSTFGSPPR